MNLPFGSKNYEATIQNVRTHGDVVELRHVSRHVVLFEVSVIEVVDFPGSDRQRTLALPEDPGATLDLEAPPVHGHPDHQLFRVSALANVGFDGFLHTEEPAQ